MIFLLHLLHLADVFDTGQRVRVTPGHGEHFAEIFLGLAFIPEPGIGPGNAQPDIQVRGVQLIEVLIALQGIAEPALGKLNIREADIPRIISPVFWEFIISILNGSPFAKCALKRRSISWVSLGLSAHPITLKILHSANNLRACPQMKLYGRRR